MAAPTMFTDKTRLGDCLHLYATNYPDRPAVRDARRTLSYAELDADVTRCAKAIHAQGIRAGDRIAVLAPPRVEALVTFLAAAKLGALWLGLNPKYKLPELDYVISDARPSLLIGVGDLDGRDYSADIDAIRRRHFSLRRFIGLDDTSTYDVSLADWMSRKGECGDVVGFEQAVSNVSSEAPALLVYTSGSSGRPKGVLLRQRELLRRSLTQNEQFPASPFPRVMNSLPINHIGGMHFLSLYTLIGAGTITLVDKYRPDEFVHALRAGEINALYTLPTMFQMLVEHPDFERSLLDELQWIVYSGAAMPRELVDLLFTAECGVGLTYGMTETCGSVTYAKKSGDNRDVMKDSIGYPTPPGEVRVVRADGHCCDVGEDGELQVRARYCMKGYFERPAETEAAFTQDGWLKTGDIARLRDDGSVKFVGRMSEMFKSGGYNVYPREIELTLEEHPHVALSAVIDVPDPLFDEVGWAYIIPTSGSPISADAMRAWCTERLANYKIPKQFIVTDSLPMLPVGKVDKVRLRQEAREQLAPRHSND